MLKDDVAQRIGEHTENCPWEDCSEGEREASYKEADFILNLIQSHAKEHGWMRNEYCKDYFGQCSAHQQPCPYGECIYVVPLTDDDFK
jgi:hypothetical protein